MTSKQILRTYAGTPPEELPEEVRARLESDSALRDELYAQARTARLMGLKRYETPDPAMPGRIRHRLNVRIENGDTSVDPVWRFDAMPEWARMLAVVIVMLGLSVMTHREMLDNETGPAGEPAPVEATGFALDGGGVGEPVFEHMDPFTTYVSFPGEGENEDVLNEVFNPRLRDPYLELGLPSTNRTERTGLLPVFQPLSP